MQHTLSSPPLWPVTVSLLQPPPPFPLSFKLSNALPSPSTASCLEDTSPLYFFYFIQPSVVLHSLSECCFFVLLRLWTLTFHLVSWSISISSPMMFPPFLSMACSINVMIILNRSAFLLRAAPAPHKYPPGDASALGSPGVLLPVNSSFLFFHCDWPHVLLPDLLLKYHHVTEISASWCSELVVKQSDDIIAPVRGQVGGASTTQNNTDDFFYYLENGMK